MNCSVMRGIQALNPKSSTFLQDDQVFDFGTIYGCDKEDLTHELHQARIILSRKQLGNILDLTVFLEPYQEVFVELFRLPSCRRPEGLPLTQRSEFRGGK